MNIYIEFNQEELLCHPSRHPPHPIRPLQLLYVYSKVLNYPLHACLAYQVLIDACTTVDTSAAIAFRRLRGSTSILLDDVLHPLCPRPSASLQTVGTSFLTPF